jgi:Glycosyl hydrolases family 16/Carboxypeptidase regulatory-like domain
MLCRLKFAFQKTYSKFIPSERGLDSSSAIHRLKLRVPVIALLFSLALANAWGAITIDANVSTNAISASSTVTSPVFSTSAPSELLLAYIATDWNSGANTFVTGVSGGGLTWSLVRRTNAQSGCAEIWMAFAAARLSNASVSASLSQTAFASLTVMSYSGVDPSSPIGATGSGNGNTTPSASLVTTRNNSWVFGVGNDFDRAIARTPGSGQNLVNQYLASVGDTYWVQMESAPTLLSGTTVFIDDTAPNGDHYNLSVVEILPLKTNSISGTVLPASLGFSTLLTLSQTGTNISTATADSLGAFTFSSIPNGTYLITPAKSGVVFTPPATTVTVSGTGATANFTATTSPTFTLSGTITGAGGNGATVTLGGAAASTTTANSSGAYSFGGLAAGSYSVTPTQPGYTFSPPSQNVTLSGANGTANFSAIAQTWSISGTVTPSAAGVLIALTGQSSGTTLTDSSGNYSFTGLPNGTYSLTPSQSGYTFTPSALPVTLNGGNASAINFTRQQPVSANIAIDATVSGVNAAAQNTVSTPSLTTHAANELLLAFVAADSSTSPNTTVNSIAGGGLTWALVTRTNVQSGTAEIWRAFAPAQINNATITASLSQSVWASLTVVSYTGADQSTADGSGAIGAVASSNASSGAPSSSIVTTRNNSWVFGVGNDFDKAIARTPASGQSLVSQFLTILGDTYWVQMQNAPTPAAGTTVLINDTAPTGDRFNLSLVEILPALATGSWSISGTVSPASLGAGATVNLSGKASTTSQADASGNYVLSNLSGGNYSVTPTKAGLIFSPVSTAVTLNGASVSRVNFLVSQAPPTYSVSGTITPTTVGAGATIKLVGPVTLSTSVNAAGAYSFTGVPAGIYSVTPTSTSASFAPLSQNVTVSATNITGINFTATATENIVFYDDFTGTSLTSDWTVISRHGEYAQNETECNVPGQVNVSNGFLTITTIAKNTTCGDFNPNGTVRTAPSSWPYATGDVQWSKFNFKYGTVTIRGRMPAFGTGLWPAFWLMGSNCQATNPFTGDTGVGTCPNPGSNGYTEIDFPECYGGTAGNWCQFHVANPGFSMGGGCDAVYPLDTNYHIFSYNWTASKISVSIDGKPISTCNTAMTYGPMFLIMQIQTGGAGGTPNNALLPSQMGVDYVKVTQP